MDTTSHELRITGQIVLKSMNGSALPAGTDIIVGTFSLTNTNSWTTNSSPNFSFYAGASTSSRTQTKVGVYYDGATSSVAATLNPSVSCSITLNQCTPPSAPTGAALQSFCSAASHTIADLTATGTAVQWYAASTGGGPLAGSSTLANGSHYFASQTVSGCESTARLDVAVTVTTTPIAPTGSASQSFCSDVSHTVADLTATGTNIQWYAGSIGGSPLAGSDILVDGTHYFASQTVSGCESTLRLDVTASVNAPPALPTISLRNDSLICSVDLSYISWHWSLNGDTIPGADSQSFVPNLNGSYTVKVTNAVGCDTTSEAFIFPPLKINELTDKSSFYISPNPAFNQLTIYNLSLNAKEAVTVSVLNILGQEAISYSLSFGEGRAEAIDISKLPSGLYLLQMKTVNCLQVRKFIKE